MSDILREVDEELRRERYQKLWERYGIYVVGAALVLVLAVAGWRGWNGTTRGGARAGARFEPALELDCRGKHRAEDILGRPQGRAARLSHAARFRIPPAGAARPEKGVAPMSAGGRWFGRSRVPRLAGSLRVASSIPRRPRRSPPDRPLIAESAFKASAARSWLARFRAGERDARSGCCRYVDDPETPRSCARAPN